MKSPLVWVGAKAWHVEAVAKMFHGSGARRLVEPFAGGASISLGVAPGFGWLNDKNQSLINFYRWLRKPGWSFNIAKDRTGYYDVRAGFNLERKANPNSLRHAQLFYYLNRHAFNGLWRVNQSGDFNVPPRPGFGEADAPDADGFRAVADKWILTVDDYEYPISECNEPDDFIYADPPYDDGFCDYADGGFTWDDQEHLARLLCVHPGPVVLMNKGTARVRDLYERCNFRITEVTSGQSFHRSQGRTDAVPEIQATLNIG